MSEKRTVVPRVIAALIAALVLVAVAPGAALAQDEDKNIWRQWFTEVADRESKAEIVFAIIFSFPAMIAITPFWLGQRLLDEPKDGDKGE